MRLLNKEGRFSRTLCRVRILGTIYPFSFVFFKGALLRRFWIYSQGEQGKIYIFIHFCFFNNCCYQYSSNRSRSTLKDSIKMSQMRPLEIGRTRPVCRTGRTIIVSGSWMILSLCFYKYTVVGGVVGWVVAFWGILEDKQWKLYF